MSNSHKGVKNGGLLWYAAAGIFILIVAAGLVASPADKADGAIVAGKSVTTGELSATETFFDFGSISMAEGKVVKKFSIKNDSAETITVRKLYTSCMCTTAYLSVGDKKRGPFGMPGHGGALTTTYQKISSGEEAEVEVIFDPAAHGPAGVGSISRVVTIEPEAGAPLELSFKANVTP